MKQKCDIIDNWKNVSIQQYKTDVGFRTLVESVNENLYIIPKYQRKYRWKKEQVVALVESLIYGFPIPPIYTCRNKENQLEILDGQQRIMSLFFYYIGYYMNTKINSCIDFSELEIDHDSFKDALLEQFELEELHINIAGQNGEQMNVDYASLPVEIKRKIDYTTITIIEIKVDEEEKKSEVLRKIFENLNKKASILSEQELRNGIYVCPFYDMLQKVNRKNERWRRIWGREDAAERDLEILLRFCAWRRFVSVKKNLVDYEFYIDDYKANYREMLDRFSEEAMKFSDTEIERYEDSLTEFFELFQVKRTQSSKVTLLESFYIVFEKLEIRKPITDEIYEKVLKNSKYTSTTSQGTTKWNRVNERWKAVYEIWAGADK
ncbi:MAG: DUF262 domain-containing protein [Lachnospiraceae bacterium]